jgi:hypothetical protein
MGEALTVISTVAAAIAALAALATLVVAFLTFREGRKTITELKHLALEASKETAAQEAIVRSTERLVQAANATAAVLHSIFLEAQAARGVEGLLRVRTALAEVTYATQRVMESQPPIVFYGARQSLRAALAGVPDAEQALPISQRIGIDTVVHARQNELQADHELDEALKAARERLAAITRQLNEAVADR